MIYFMDNLDDLSWFPDFKAFLKPYILYAIWPETTGFIESLGILITKERKMQRNT